MKRLAVILAALCACAGAAQSQSALDAGFARAQVQAMPLEVEHAAANVEPPKLSFRKLSRLPAAVLVLSPLAVAESTGDGEAVKRIVTLGEGGKKEE